MKLFITIATACLIATLSINAFATTIVAVPEFKMKNDNNFALKIREKKMDSAVIDFGNVKCETKIKFITNQSKSVIEATFSPLTCSDNDIIAPEIMISLPAVIKYGYMIPTAKFLVLVK